MAAKKTSQSKSKYVTSKQLSQIIGLGVHAIHRRVADGDFRSVKVGRNHLIDLASAMEWIEAQPSSIRQKARKIPSQENIGPEAPAPGGVWHEAFLAIEMAHQAIERSSLILSVWENGRFLMRRIDALSQNDQFDTFAIAEAVHELTELLVRMSGRVAEEHGLEIQRSSYPK